MENLLTNNGERTFYKNPVELLNEAKKDECWVLGVLNKYRHHNIVIGHPLTILYNEAKGVNGATNISSSAIKRIKSALQYLLDEGYIDLYYLKDREMGRHKGMSFVEQSGKKQVTLATNITVSLDRRGRLPNEKIDNNEEKTQIEIFQKVYLKDLYEIHKEPFNKSVSLYFVYLTVIDLMSSQNKLKEINRADIQYRSKTSSTSTLYSRLKDLRRMKLIGFAHENISEDRVTVNTYCRYEDISLLEKKFGRSMAKIVESENARNKNISIGNIKTRKSNASEEVVQDDICKSEEVDKKDFFKPSGLRARAAARHLEETPQDSIEDMFI